MTTLEYSLTFADLKQTYIAAVAGKPVCKRAANQRHVQELVNEWRRPSGFYGPSSAQVIEWLHKGYKEAPFKLDPPIEPVRKRRRLMYGEEGELQIDLMRSGYDYPFLDWTHRETMPGMSCRIHVCFSASTNINVINNYYRFALRSLIALESAGIDLEISFTEYTAGCFVNDSDSLLHHVQVKKEGEQTDYLGWSAILSPSYRHFFFLSEIISADVLGKTVTASLGHGNNDHQPWEVNYENENRRLNFLCPYHPTSFPEKEMEIQLRTVLSEARRRVA